MSRNLRDFKAGVKPTEYLVDRKLHLAIESAIAERQPVFPNADWAVALIDRLTHHGEIVAIGGESYRRRDAQTHQKQQWPPK